MARKLRVQYPGAIYHAMSRGDRREAIFQDARDREIFLATLAEACRKTAWQVHAYVLMPNHFHLVIETPQPNLVTGTTRTVEWIARRLRMGSRGYANQLLHRARRPASRMPK